MRQQHGTLKLTVGLALSLCAVPIVAQVPLPIRIPLKINEDYQQRMGQLVTFSVGTDNSATSLPADSTSELGRAPGGVLVRVERVQGQSYAYSVQVDSDGDGDVADEVSQVAQANFPVIVRVSRRWPGGKQRSLPYLIKYSRDTDHSNQVREFFMWSPHYRAEGMMKTKNCAALFAVLDMNGDGLFDRADFSGGTSINLDRNGVGQFQGADEWLMGEQIIEYCGETFLIDGVEANGISATLSKTTLRVPKIGERLPAFSLKTLDGKVIRSDELRGRIHLLDFWASWCKPCVEKFALVKQLGQEFKGLTIIAINVDARSRLPTARKAIKDYSLRWPQVMRGQGERDPLWKMFGGMEGNRLGIPLYVLIDNEGMLRYAGRGGDDLSELHSSIRALAVVK